MLELFKHQIDWKKLSWTDSETILTPDCLEQFADYWDWSKLSGNESLPLDYDTIDRFIDKWNWSELIDQPCLNNTGASHLYGTEFLERYVDRIPAEALYRSHLWRTIMEQRAKELQRKILSGEL